MHRCVCLCDSVYICLCEWVIVLSMHMLCYICVRTCVCRLDTTCVCNKCDHWSERDLMFMFPGQMIDGQCLR